MAFFVPRQEEKKAASSNARRPGLTWSGRERGEGKDITHFKQDQESEKGEKNAGSGYVRHEIPPPQKG